MKNKKGVFFSLDALIAVSIILLTLLVVFPVIKYQTYETQIPSDIVNVLSTLKIGEINNSYVKTLISQGNITDLNKSLLEQIGEFYVIDINTAKILANSILSSINTSDNIGIWYEDTLLASVNSTPIEEADEIGVIRQTISGISEGESVTGFSARAFLSGSMPKKYYYFGGYVGDGNISLIIDSGEGIESVNMELAINDDFDVYINNIFSGSYNRSSSTLSPSNYNLNAYLGNFNNGSNTIKFVGPSLYIAGGFVKVTYQNFSSYEEASKYNFPGIDGLINLYDGFYIPNTLQTLKIFLHYNSNVSIFMTIGNVTVFNDSGSEGDKILTIEDTELQSLLNYASISKKTVPVRLGLVGSAYDPEEGLNADIFSVAPLPSSFNSVTDNYGNKKVDVITYANRNFINILSAIPTIRIGLVGIDKDGVDPEDFHNLSKDTVSLNNTLNNWALKGGVCICCGLNTAVDSLNDESNSTNLKSVVLMADNPPTAGCGGDPTQDAIDVACNAWDNYEIRFDTIAVGNSVSGQEMLQEIADCTNGSYYQGDHAELADIYQEVAQDLLEVIFYKQSVTVIGDLTTKLYSDSYIEFNYTKAASTPGLILVDEIDFYDENQGNFSIPPNSTILETKIVSYSGPRWTNYIGINFLQSFNLTNYGSNYLELGDPYSINIHNSLVNSENNVQVKTGTNPNNSSGGSISNKIISTTSRTLLAYSSISSNINGCTWILDFEDNTNLTTSVPSNYSGPSTCYYQENREEYDQNDAIQSAVYNLLKLIDFDGNGKLDVKFSEQDFDISSSEITGIPYGWSTEVQIRRWR